MFVGSLFNNAELVRPRCFDHGVMVGAWPHPLLEQAVVRLVAVLQGVFEGFEVQILQQCGVMACAFRDFHTESHNFMTLPEELFSDGLHSDLSFALSK